MKRHVTKMIAQWFANHSGDGDFLCCQRVTPYTVIGPPTTRGRVILGTKPSLVSSAMCRCAELADFGFVGRCGLPGDADPAWIRAVVGERELLFLGDMDPVDLLVFAWLRETLHPKHITHLGVNDVLLDILGLSSLESLSTVLAVSEQQSLPILRNVLPDLRETIGEKCLRILDGGKKIEVEGILGDLDTVGKVFRSLG